MRDEEETVTRPPKKSRTTMSDRERRWAQFYALVRKIPRGRISTYGDIGALAGTPRWARHVGAALSALEKADAPQRVPWHRVLGARSGGRAGISILDPIGGARQRKLLEAEGVEFDARGNVSFAEYGWPPRPKKVRPKRGSR
jgi:methylated-DNA-protein-cysteine methyltransferase-like protein